MLALSWEADASTFRRTRMRLLETFASFYLVCTFFQLFGGCRLQRWEDTEAGIRTAGRRLSSSIQEMMVGPNTILNRSRGEAGYKSIPSPNDHHHLDHIFSAHCCVDVWLSWGSLIHRKTHWSYVRVTFWKGGGAKSKFLRQAWQC